MERATKTRRNSRWNRFRAVAAALVAAAATWPLAGVAQPPRESAPSTTDGAAALAQIEQTLTEVIARAEPSVVAISRTTPRQPASIERALGQGFNDLRANIILDAAPTAVGAGIIIDRAGLVLTQYLNVREGDEHAVTTTEGKTYPATIRAADPRSSLAILAIDPTASPLQRAGKPAARATTSSSFPAIRFGDAATLRKGQFVVAIGNPFAILADGQPTASWGIVTNLSRKAPAGTNLNDAPGPNRDYRTTLHHLGTLIQTDAKLGWNTGGGALVNLRGELVGVTTTASTIAGHEQPAGYAIPINAALRRIIDTLKQGREVEYGMLGVSFGQSPILPMAPPTTEAPQLTLLQVYPGSPADRAGLAAGDAVTRIGKLPVEDVDAIQLAVSLMLPSTNAIVEYERQGQSAATSVTLAKLAVSGKKIASVKPESWRGLRVDFATALEAIELAQAISSDAYDQQGCVLVTDVEDGSESWKAGVRPGMFISHVGGQRVATPAEFAAAAEKIGEFDIRLTQPVTPTETAPKPDASKPQ